MRLRIKNLILALALGIAGASVATAVELPDTEVLALQQRLEGLALSPPQPDDVLQASRERLQTSVTDLEQHLSQSDPQTQAAWKDWLGVELIRQELASPADDLGQLPQLYERYFDNQPGLELSPLIGLRTELGHYLTARNYVDAATPSDWYREQVQTLAESLQAMTYGEDPEAARRAGQTLTLLESLSDDHARLARELRARYCRDNAYAQVSGRILNHLIQQEIKERSFISDFVFGSSTRGTVDMRGLVSFGMAPSDTHGTLVVQLAGNALCPDLVASRRQVSVYSSSRTNIRAEKQVQLSDLGLTLLPATANCTSTMQLRDIDARSRLVESIAWRRASRLVPEAQSHTSRRAEQEASTKLDEQAEASLGNVNKLFCEKFRAPMLRLGAFPDIKFSSTATHLRLSLAQYARGQFAAAGEPPAYTQDHDLAFTIHDSMISNLSETLLSGKTVRDEAWEEIMKVALGSAPRELWVHDRSEPWSVTFASERPVVTRFRNGEILITLRLSAIARGERTLNEPTEVEIVIQPVITADGPVLIREQPIVVRFGREEDARSEEFNETRAFLSSKFGAFFPEELFFSGLVPPVGGALEKLRDLELTEFASRQGWLTLAYHLRVQATSP